MEKHRTKVSCGQMFALPPHTAVMVAIRGSAPPSPVEPLPQRNKEEAMVTGGFPSGFNMSYPVQGAVLIPIANLVEVTQSK